MFRPKRALTSATIASSLASDSNSGKLSRPPQIPDGGRSSSSTAPLASCIASTVCARTGRSRTGRGVGSLSIVCVAARDTRVVDGACGAIRTAARANRRAQIHQPLRVCLDLIGRQKAFRALPELTLDLRAAGIALDAAMTRQHTPDVAVENRGALTKRKCGDRGGGRAADAGQLRELFDFARELSAMMRRRSVARSGANCALASNTPVPPSIAITDSIGADASARTSGKRATNRS